MTEQRNDVDKFTRLRSWTSWPPASHQKAAAAWKDGVFNDEVVPVSDSRSARVIPSNSPTDEGIRANTTAESLGGLKPAFRKDGTITAGSASQISDGACAVVVMSKAKAEELGPGPGCAEIGAHGVVAGPDSTLQSQPANAIKKAIAKRRYFGRPAGRRRDQRGVLAAVSLASTKELGIDPEKVNVNGGAIAVGHPIGMSGARIALHVALELKPACGSGYARRGTVWCGRPGRRAGPAPPLMLDSHTTAAVVAGVVFGQNGVP